MRLPEPLFCGPLARRGCGLALALLMAGWLAGCAAPLSPLPKLQAARSEADAVAVLGPPTQRYAMPDGSTRLEFARGPAGYETWMVDLAADGRVLRSEQVLNLRRFADVRRGMTRDELLRLLGRPAARQPEFQGRETWYWRYDPYECIWYAVTLDPRGRVISGGSGLPDPRCDVSQ